MLAKRQSDWNVAGRKVKWYSLFGKHFGSDVNNIYLSYDPAVLLLSIIFPREMKTYVPTKDHA